MTLSVVLLSYFNGVVSDDTQLMHL